MVTLSDWIQLAEPAQMQRLADISDTSRAYLYQLSRGLREAGPELAGRIADATAQLAGETGLPVLSRGDLNGACAECPYYKRCKGND